jgi:hypothetical protein
VNRRQAKKVLRSRREVRSGTLRAALDAYNRVSKRPIKSNPALWCPPKWTVVGFYGRKVGFMFCKQLRIKK